MKRRYTGTSRTTRWRRKKARRDQYFSSSSSDETDNDGWNDSQQQDREGVYQFDYSSSAWTVPGLIFQEPIDNTGHIKHLTAETCLQTGRSESFQDHTSSSSSSSDSECDRANAQEPNANTGHIKHLTAETCVQTGRSECFQGQPNSSRSRDLEYDGANAQAMSPPSSLSCSSDEDMSSDLECCTAHYLNEEPGADDDQQQPVEVQPRLGYDPGSDDPDDPDSDEDAYLSESSNESDEDNNLEPANLRNGDLNHRVQLHLNLTKGEVILLELASAVRHNKTFVSILDSFRSLNVLFGPKFFPECKSSLWRAIHLNRVGMKSHIYCSRRMCGEYLGVKERLQGIIVCRCGMRVNVNKARFFVTLDLRKQIKLFLEAPGIWEKLQHRLTRRKRSPTAIEDVYDGQLYQQLQQEGQPLSSPFNFSYIFNTDGCKPTRKGTLKMWPIYVRINELPPELRQKFSFVAAVYIDHVDPNFQSFLKPFVKTANSLSNRGIVWRPDGLNEVRSKFVPLGHGVDSPARCGILHMTNWNSDYGCTYCTHRGVQDGGNQRYSVLNLDGIPAFADRTHEGMVADMITAHQTGMPHMGHKGPSQMLLMQNHDLRLGQGVDDLHQDHEGCAADITELLLTEAPRVRVNMPTAELLREIDNRLLHIKTPSRISRKPRSITKRGKYNGTEWRNWLLFYAVPCLSGLIHPDYVNLIGTLSHACHLLSQESIEPADLIEAQRLLSNYARAFEEKFHRQRMKFNLHVTTSHKVNCVRVLGPPRVYSTYNFESLNMKTIQNVTSPQGAPVQMLTRALLRLTVNAALYDENLSPEVRERLLQILSKETLQHIRQVGDSLYVVGKETRRVPSVEEAGVLEREGFNQIENFEEYGSALVGNTRYRSIASQNPEIRSDDTFIYSAQNTYCTIQKIITFMDINGQEQSGMFVLEHDVSQVRHHLCLLQNDEANLLHFLGLVDVRCPAVRIAVQDTVYAVNVPNCFEID